MAEKKNKAKSSLTAKQKKFCDEYLIDLNATQAAIRAGYSKKTAYSIGDENLKKPELKKYIDKRMAEKEMALIADQDEVLKYLTSVLRGESQSAEIVVEGTGLGCSEASLIEKTPSEKDRLKAAELLGKRYGLYSDQEKLNIEKKRLELEEKRYKLEEQKQNMSGGDEGQYGVVMLAPILPDEDEEAD